MQGAAPPTGSGAGHAGLLLCANNGWGAMQVVGRGYATAMGQAGGPPCTAAASLPAQPSCRPSTALQGAGRVEEERVSAFALAIQRRALAVRHLPAVYQALCQPRRCSAGGLPSSLMVRPHLWPLPTDSWCHLRLPGTGSSRGGHTPVGKHAAAGRVRAGGRTGLQVAAGAVKAAIRMTTGSRQWRGMHGTAGLACALSRASQAGTHPTGCAGRCRSRRRQC